MPRAVRIEYPGDCYHVMCRGERREGIFRRLRPLRGDVSPFDQESSVREDFVGQLVALVADDVDEGPVHRAIIKDPPGLAVRSDQDAAPVGGELAGPLRAVGFVLPHADDGMIRGDLARQGCASAREQPGRH